jgi:hypothetical protein
MTLIRITRGRPTDAEIAAVVAALLAFTKTEAIPAPRSAWADRARVRAPLPRPGPGAWRASAWPR